MDLQDRIDQMKVMKSYDFEHVLIPRDRGYTEHDNPDYRGTGLALCGILKQGQSLESFRSDWIVRKLKN
jgi:hypothetical protein